MAKLRHRNEPDLSRGDEEHQAASPRILADKPDRLPDGLAKLMGDFETGVIGKPNKLAPDVTGHNGP